MSVALEAEETTYSTTHSHLKENTLVNKWKINIQLTTDAIATSEMITYINKRGRPQCANEKCLFFVLFF